MRTAKILCSLVCVVALSTDPLITFAQSASNATKLQADESQRDKDSADAEPQPLQGVEKPAPKLRPKFPPNERRRGPHFNEAEQQRRRAERRAQWQQRKFENARARQQWLAASSVSCYQANTPILKTDNASVVVPNGSRPWTEISFVEDGHPRNLALLSPTLSCSYDRHDASLPGADGDVAGGFESTSGTSQFPRAEMMTCHRNGVQVVQARMSNIVIGWNGANLRMSFINDENRPETVTIDVNDMGCIFEEL